MNTPAEFKRIKPGDSVVLTDDQTITDLIDQKADRATDGLSLRVSSVRHITEQSKIATWVIATLEGGEIPLYLMVKAVDEEMDVRIYYQPDDTPTGSRADLLENGCQWIFREPKLDPEEDLIPSDLDMTVDFNQEHGGKTVVFKVKGNTFYCELWERPTPGGLKMPMFSAITEYAAEDYTEIENPELVVLESGGLDDDGENLPQGGLVQILQGANVSLGDITLLSC